MDVKEFYQEKIQARERLTRELLAGKHEGQPELEEFVDTVTDVKGKRPVAVYITSVRKREAGTTTGHVCLATIDNASYRIADGTHRVSTPEEIKNYMRHQVDQKLMHDKIDVARDAKKMQIIQGGLLPSAIPQHLQAVAPQQGEGEGSNARNKR